MKKLIYLFFTIAVLASCGPEKNSYDASGVFEADEIIISSEMTGAIKELNMREGMQLIAGQYVGYIDTTQLYLKKKQLEAQVSAVLSRKPNSNAQLASLQEQLKHAINEKERVERLLASDAATQKQLDDATAQVAILKKQILAQQSTLNISSSSITEESNPLSIQVEQVNDQLLKSKIVNPLNGVVLAKYASVNEVTTIGKPLYKIADLSFVFLRAYLTGSQLANLKLNQKVTVLVDNGKGEYRNYEGTIEWISDKSEFTPKTIQTVDERANLVYATKIRVKNDGLLKIGMYGEVKF
jgi:HlyD family secretion protein